MLDVPASRARQLTLEVLRAARERPSFALYLVALVLLPAKWLSPFAHRQAGWTDVFLAAAALVWIVEELRRGARPRLRAPHYGLAVYLAAGLASAAVASGTSHSTAAGNLLIMVELVALAVLTSHFARSRAGFRAIALVVLFDVALTAVLALLALGLFYAGKSTSLIWEYGDLKPSNAYARVAAGFYSAPLLGSFCIFASAVIAAAGTTLPRRARAAAQVALVCLVVLTVSRSIIGFGVAWAIRWAARSPSPAARRAVVGAVAVALAAMVALTLGRLQIDPASPSSARYHFLQVSGNPRLTSVRKAAETFAAHPLVGIGPGGLAGEIDHGASRAHLTPLNVAATVGAPALAGLAFAVTAIWWRRRRPTNIAIWAGLAGLGVDGLGQDIEHFRHAWILLGLADADRADDRAAGKPG